MVARDTASPQGLSLHPAPPTPVRVTKLAGIIGLVLVAGVLVLIVFGASRRRQQQQTTASREAASSETSALQDSSVLKNDLERSVQPRSQTYGSLQGPSGSSSSFGGPSAEDERRDLSYQKELEAINAPSKVQGDVQGGRAVGSTRELAQNFQSLGPGRNGPGNGMLGNTHSDDTPENQNRQDQKEAFLSAARQRREENYLKATRTAALGPYEIKAGWDIPAVLEQAMNSDLPGEIHALVRVNVYDTATGRFLLIPQGARLVGSYNSNVTFGQSGLQAVWNRIIFPDGSSLNLDGMNGTDEKGASGFRANVDHHYKSLFASALLTSVLAAGLQLSQNTSGGQSLLVTPTPAQATSQAVGQQLTQLGAEITRKNLNIQPTVKIPIGYRFNVRVNRDIIFDAPYKPYSR